MSGPTQRLAIWKRVIIALQLLTFPIWLLPYALIVGLLDTVPEIPRFVSDALKLITAPLDREEPAPATSKTEG